MCVFLRVCISVCVCLCCDITCLCGGFKVASGGGGTNITLSCLIYFLRFLRFSVIHQVTSRLTWWLRQICGDWGRWVSQLSVTLRWRDADSLHALGASPAHPEPRHSDAHLCKHSLSISDFTWNTEWVFTFLCQCCCWAAETWTYM